MAGHWDPSRRYRRGPPARIHFNGFESDTHRLQQQGWRVAEEVDEFHYDRSLRYTIILMAPDGRLKLRGFCRENRYRQSIYEEEYLGPLYFEVDEWFHDYKVGQEMRFISAKRFREFDGSHTIMDRMVALDWGSVFPPRNDKEVLVDKADMSVVEHLEEILRMQAPKQKELRQKAAHESADQPIRLIRVA